MTLWQRFKADFKERFLNYKTALQFFFIPAGVIIGYTALFYEQYAFKISWLLLAIYLITRGFIELFRNPITAELKKKALLQKRIEEGRG